MVTQCCLVAVEDAVYSLDVLSFPKKEASGDSTLHSFAVADSCVFEPHEHGVINARVAGVAVLPLFRSAQNWIGK